MELEENIPVNEEGRREIEKKKKKLLEEKELGGVKTLPFIISNEISEKFATEGFHGNMITYLTLELNLPLVKASNILTNFNGLAGFTPLVGALIADSFSGRFWMIIAGSSLYVLGLASLILSAILPGLRPPHCPTQENCKEASDLQLWVLYTSLLLTSLGLGGIRPCVVTFAADQLGMSKNEVESRSWNFFNWYFFSLETAGLLALTFVFYVQDHVGWGWGLGIPTIAMALSIIVFIIGSPYYKKQKPEGSPLVRLAQVIAAALHKRKAIAPADSGLLYQNKELDATISSNGRLLHTNQYKWFDKAAIVTVADKSDSNPPNLWRVSTVHRVEELKSIIRMLPIWASGILPIIAYSHQGSFSIQQARTMDRSISPSLKIPPATMSIFQILSILIGLLLYERLFVPFARRFTRIPSGITTLQRMGIGYAINVFGTLIAAMVEMKRRGVATNHNLLGKPTAIIPISVFWLVPQYWIHGMALAFVNVGRIEFFYDQSPESMRSTSTSFFWIAVALGNYAGTLMVSLIHDYTGKGGGRNWIPNRNLNSGRLEYYYLFVSGLQVVNMMYYLICTKFYIYKALEEVSEGITEGRAAELPTDKKTPSKSMAEW
ncbi:protein NRT1/ PTR FAMILY 3.1-like isoform X2 [Rhododendron vialii]|uniref:protein NRT1/ PTR FAMILY 3.1-like isoform X1 n=1 Tax=Rhododendron vialii TaxID=182163 RepID=UPI00265F76E2|nr:protein NRT1/ PTR FAMILY 3.1-like isoform X1 [Rhododendron vialii]XP_058209482.1 protein NRT1/ PTR FAMILY 3.1-like isoform X2 [Rhododendron vialii]